MKRLTGQGVVSINLYHVALKPGDEDWPRTIFRICNEAHSYLQGIDPIKGFTWNLLNPLRIGHPVALFWGHCHIYFRACRCALKGFLEPNDEVVKPVKIV